MASVVEICNKALTKIGQSTITSLSDGNKAARLCNSNWGILRDEVLRSHNWNFAIKREITSPLSTSPEWGFEYQHQLPSDCLRLIQVRDLSTNDFQLEGNRILCNEDTLYVRYVSCIEDSAQYDSQFVNAVAARLAFELCESFTQNNTKKQAIWAEYQDALIDAKMTDAVENPPEEFEESDYILTRY